jgi:hypothetical protein
LDRVRVHAYVSNPNTSFNYSKNRLIDFANGNPGLNISILFSSEPNFMQNWLNNNSMDAAENIFIADWMNESSGWVNNFNLEGFTYFTYTDMQNIPLAVELTYFKGQLIDQGIQLNWETSSETNSDYFVVERQNTNTNKFNAIGAIKSIENSTSNTPYQFIDKNPNIGLNNYRLKQFDVDDQFQYSKTIAFSYHGQHKKPRIYPSLVEDIISIEAIEGIDQILIYDTNGRKVKEINGLDTIQSEISVSNLNVGVYSLILKSGVKTEIFRFVKQN